MSGWRQVLLLMVCLAAGCGSNDASTAERLELANLPSGLRVPSSSPATLWAAFRKYCVDTPSDPAVRTALLRASNYVPAGGWSRGIRRFVIAGSSPMVILSDTGRACAVRARARTGQTATLEREIVRRWPGARAGTRNGGVETHWLTGDPATPLVAVMRNAAGAGLNEITLALVRP